MSRQCEFCGLFMGRNSPTLVYIPYGGPLAEEPPGACYIHSKCWDEADEGRKDLVKRISWVGPYEWVNPYV